MGAGDDLVDGGSFGVAAGAAGVAAVVVVSEVEVDGLAAEPAVGFFETDLGEDASTGCGFEGGVVGHGGPPLGGVYRAMARMSQTRRAMQARTTRIVTRAPRGPLLAR